MKLAARLIWLGLVFVPLPCSGMVEVPAESSKTITKDFKDVPIVDVLAEINAQLPEPGTIIFAPSVPKDLRVTLSLHNAKPVDAFVLAIRAAGLKAEDLPEGGPGLILSLPPTVSVGASRVPVVGAMPIWGSSSTSEPFEPLFALPSERGGAPATMPGVGISYRFSGGGASRPGFPGDDTLVDLEIQDAPIRDAATAITAASGIKIVVHDAVAEDIKVTARTYRMPLSEVLGLIVDKANLTYTVSYGANVEAPAVVRTVQRMELDIESARRELAVARQGLEKAEAMVADGVLPQERLEAARLAVSQAEAKLRLAELNTAEVDAARKASRTPVIHIVPKPVIEVTGPSIAAGKELTARRALALKDHDTIFSSRACPKCERLIPLSADWEFCPHCGADLRTPRPEVTVPQKPSD